MNDLQWPLDRHNPAFGSPGAEPLWTSAAKDAVGTAYSTRSRIWYTIKQGIVNEVYFPTIDRPQLRDAQLLISNGKSFADEERTLQSTIEGLSHDALGFRVRSTHKKRGYSLIKEIFGDPHQDTLLIHTVLEGKHAKKLRLYLLIAPHLGLSGRHNNAYTADVAGRRVLVAQKERIWMAAAATVPFGKTSCGYVGRSDGWTDLFDNFALDWEFDAAEDGNVALIGELRLDGSKEFTTGIAFGDTLHNAVTTLFQSLDDPYSEQRQRYIDQWQRACARMESLDNQSRDGGRLRHTSHMLLLAHEDKIYQGAMIASLSIPWGEVRTDDIGGYHFVWTRDMCNSAAGLIASGVTETALRALIYLACAQEEDGGFCQNFWVDGKPHWRGIQLDETSFPILLAWKLHVAGALRDFDPYPMVRAAARYLIREGPATQQERWEENSGYSPSTLATNIAALTCASLFARERGDVATAEFIQEYADFLECHIERWTVTTEGALVPGIHRHYIRLRPSSPQDPYPDEDPNRGVLVLPNQPPGAPTEYSAKDIIDAGFLELVRYGIRKAGDPLIEDSLRVIDAVLKVDTPFGPCWHRYNHDGYGQRADGSAWVGWGVGRAWPLLTGERAHYEFAAGRDVSLYIRSLERFANPMGLIPEQVWDEPGDLNGKDRLGMPTGSAMPLMWAHSEYLKLLRSVRDGQVFDRIAAVAERYVEHHDHPSPLEIWKPNRRVRTLSRGTRLRVQAPEPFILHWTTTEWEQTSDTKSTTTSLGIDYVDIPLVEDDKAFVDFTFYWPRRDRWEGQNFRVTIQ